MKRIFNLISLKIGQVMTNFWSGGLWLNAITFVLTLV